jgi:branched-subunit amino acid transport protein AzlD
MNVSLQTALGLTFAMGGIIFFCRLFPFLFFREKPTLHSEAGAGKKTDSNRQDEVRPLACGEKTRPPGEENRARDAEKNFSRREIFLNFVEKLVPPAAMTVLAFNAITGSFKTNFREGVPVLIAATLTALIHLWKRNPLFSIFGGVAAYMILERIILR